MNYIDNIYYQATSTDATTGYITYIQAQYAVPFFDYLLIYTTFMFTVSICGLLFFIFKKNR